MDSSKIADQLNDAIDQLMASPESLPAGLEPEVHELAQLATELRSLPRAAFKEELKMNLLKEALKRATPQLTNDTAVLPTLFGAGYGTFPVQRVNFAASFLLHAAAMALILTSGVWFAQHHELKTQVTANLLTDPGEYILSPAPDKAGGGGGGGDHDKLAAPKGALPRQSMQDQLAPPAVVIRNNDPALPVEPTVMVPPNISLPHAGQLGDPLSAIVGAASNGTGSGGGIGSGSGSGVGSGTGRGVGPGFGMGIGNGVFRVGGGVSAPRPLYDPDPEYSDEARKAKYQGVVVLGVIIGADGRPKDMRVQRSLGMGLDEKAMEAVRSWKFAPAMKDGQPVAVQVSIEVNFRLY